MSDAHQAAQESLSAHLRQMALVASCQELLAWDELTLLPAEGSEFRGRQLAHLACVYHDLLTDSRLDEALQELSEAADGSGVLLPGAPQSGAAADGAIALAINVREVCRLRARHARLPRRLIDELVQTTTQAQHQWQLARERDEYERFRPWLDRVIALKREEARALSEGGDLYAPLLAEYEPHVPLSEVCGLFQGLETDLANLLPPLLDSEWRRGAAASRRVLRGRFPVSQQQRLCAALAASAGFDFSRGRLDTAVHPFTSHLGPHDCRLAIRYDESNLAEGLYALLHELGHGLYDQGLRPAQYGLPAGEAASLSVHEALARLWENIVGRSLGFWRWLLPQARAMFPGELTGVCAEQVWQEVRRVEAGTNRVAADEATYNLHILMRFKLEREIIAGNLNAADLPSAWNECSRSLLGIEPKTDREGILQDGHWAAGMFGYFPTYTLGNVLAAQLFGAATRDLGDLDQQFAEGEFRPLREWLHTRIFQHGKRFTTTGLVQAVCSSRLDPAPLVERLRSRVADPPLPATIRRPPSGQANS